MAHLPASVQSEANHHLGSQYQDQPSHCTGPSQRTQTTLAVAAAAKHELSWLLFEGETENEILANPYIFEDDVEILLQGLFEKEQS